MTEEEKANRKAVREYLAAVDANKPRRGRKRTPESIDKKLEKLDADLRKASPLKRLEITQERIDLLEEKEQLLNAVDPSHFEDAFIAHAKAYADAKGLTYAAWREVGVSADILKKAGITS